MWPLLGLVFKWVSAATAAYSAVSSYQTGKESAKQAEYNAEADAERKSRDAKQIQINRQAEEKAEAKQAQRRRAAAEAAYAKSGVLIEGTPGEFLAEQAAVDEQNIMQRTRTAQARGMGLRIAAQDTRILGGMRARSMRSQATGSLIGGMGQAAGLGARAAQATDSWLNEV